MKPTLPQGTRDFAAETLRKRRYIMDTIREVFELYGFEPLETPAMENLETLMGKYGEEGDKLIFKILNNGLEHPGKRENALKDFEHILSGKNNKHITERALRYDLTIPFARYMAMNHGKITLPFRRYQIQPVWRADRPQKGRYREFLQCDADIAGSYSLICDVELAEIYATVFKRLQIEVDIRVNSRKILLALAEACGNADQLSAITVAIDKLDKAGPEKVKEELALAGLSSGSLDLIENYIHISGTNSEKLEKAEAIVGSSPAGRKGLEELRFILDLLNNAGRSDAQHITIDFTLARGLNYYTGVIYEVKASKIPMGSIGGGGRYDDLTGLFGVTGIPGVGISFGLDRIFDVMEEGKLFPAGIDESTQVLFFNLGEKESRYAFGLMQQLRENNISCELYYENSRLDKQFKYASRKKIAFAVIIGSQEMEAGNCVVKDLAKNEQQVIPAHQIVPFFLK
jgi:histidyl-tRNA synthetase